MTPLRLATGQLTRAEPKVMRGTITFAAGTRPASLTITGRDGTQWAATLRVGDATGAMLWFPPDVAGMFDAVEDKPAHWHGYVTVDGYVMRAEILREGAVVLCDCKQPMRIKAAAE